MRFIKLQMLLVTRFNPPLLCFLQSETTKPQQHSVHKSPTPLFFANSGLPLATVFPVGLPLRQRRYLPPLNLGPPPQIFEDESGGGQTHCDSQVGVGQHRTALHANYYVGQQIFDHQKSMVSQPSKGSGGARRLETTRSAIYWQTSQTGCSFSEQWPNFSPVAHFFSAHLTSSHWKNTFCLGRTPPHLRCIRSSASPCSSTFRNDFFRSLEKVSVKTRGICAACCDSSVLARCTWLVLPFRWRWILRGTMVSILLSRKGSMRGLQDSLDCVGDVAADREQQRVKERRGVGFLGVDKYYKISLCINNYVGREGWEKGGRQIVARRDQQ